MSAPILNPRDLQFMLYEVFNALELTKRDRYEDHNQETFDAAIETAKTVAEKYFLPIRQKIDQQQPTFDGKSIDILPEIKPALDAIYESGLANSVNNYEAGGMQLPPIIANAAWAYISATASMTAGYISLTQANCNLLEAHGSETQINRWVKPMREGRFAGTMAMTEPGAGSGLADLITTAERQDDGTYRITGNKVFISGGDHDFNENIVHLVLARVKGAPKGIKGISLFIVPKYLIDEHGNITEQNDVALTGLFHKMGGRGHTSTALNFGEKGGAIGELVGEENLGLSYMFHMMNEARFMVGIIAAISGLTGYQYSLNYAKNRPQGRLLSCKDPLSPPVNIIEHPDVKRLLIAQKAYSEGAFALCLYAIQLFDDSNTATTQSERKQAHILLDFLTPIVKAWPSEFCVKANDMAIQVLGGYGYTNEHPVEMFYRDNRLNSIHEGTTAIQSLDLLGRKVPMKDFAGFKQVMGLIVKTCADAKDIQSLQPYAEQLGKAVDLLGNTTQTVMGATQNQNIDLVFANCVSYLKMFGHITIAWMWLKQATVSEKKLADDLHQDDINFYLGKVQTMKYFFNVELPQIKHWSKLVTEVDSSAFDMQEAWF